MKCGESGASTTKLTYQTHRHTYPTLKLEGCWILVSRGTWIGLVCSKPQFSPWFPLIQQREFGVQLHFMISQATFWLSQHLLDVVLKSPDYHYGNRVT